jgi:hypothetical protein
MEPVHALTGVLISEKSQVVQVSDLEGKRKRKGKRKREGKG